MPTLPLPLLNSLHSLKGFDEKAFKEAHEEGERVTSLRLNPFKPVTLDFELGGNVPWCKEAFYLDIRPSFTRDPLFQAGCYYVQEAGSMFIQEALTQHLDFTGSLRVLDACAAPGGKSTLLNSLLSDESLLVANEMIKSRADVLVQNLSKWGRCNSVVTNNETGRFGVLTSYFDLIVVDAPCSGSGLFRKQPEAINEWSIDHVKACSIRQQKIVEDLLPSLKEDGLMVYSTCSYSEEENESVVAKLIAEHDMEFVKITVDEGWGIVETGLGYRFYPHLLKSEGFFCAVLRKKIGVQGSRPHRKNLQEASKADLQLLVPFIELKTESVIKKNEQFHLLNAEAAGFLSSFEKQFYFKKAGAVVGEIKGRDVVPNQELAWCTRVGKEVNRIEINLEKALKFLKKEAFSVDGDEKGLALITYKEQGLGWAKILPNRINNYLPNELRILK